MMQFIALFVGLFSLIYLTHAAVLRTAMRNNYPQISVLGCGSNKANLYFDMQRQVWVEHLVSSCVEDEKSILQFCQQAYPSLNIGNIIRLDTVLRFENWCELIPSLDDNIPRCKSQISSEETVQPFRCLHDNSAREDVFVPSTGCTVNNLVRQNECLRSEKWQEFATLHCSKQNTMLNSSIIPLNWCGLSEFHGVKFHCCILKDLDVKNDYQSNIKEDDPIDELIVLPKSTTEETHRRIIAMSLGTREPNWIEDYRRWSSDSGYFADDEDTLDDQEEIKLSSTRKSHLTINEHERFSKEKQSFKTKYNQQIDELKTRWQKRQNELQLLANENPREAQNQYEQVEFDFRQEYDSIKQTAARERTRINEIHEDKLDSIIGIAKKETNQKLNTVWAENPLKTENIKEALYNYLHVLLRDRIHLVNRYERLRVVDPEQAKRKRVLIHERLRTIAMQIESALNKLRTYSNLRTKIQPHIDNLLSEYEQVNQAAEKLLAAYINSSTTAAVPIRRLPLGRDENKIYPFANTGANKLQDDEVYNEYDYDKNDEVYDDDDDDDESTTTTNIPINNQAEVDGRDREQYDLRPLIPMENSLNRRRRPTSSSAYFLMSYLPYIIGCLLILCITFAVLIFRHLIQQRRRAQYGHNYEKNYVFTEVASSTPEDKALHALQANGYENPTYRFFESQSPKC